MTTTITAAFEDRPTAQKAQESTEVGIEGDAATARPADRRSNA